jgi:putative Mn2+ efflux pump MntP
VWLGKHFGTRFSHKAEILGGALLILIGIEIFLTGIL